MSSLFLMRKIVMRSPSFRMFSFLPTVAHRGLSAHNSALNFRHMQKPRETVLKNCVFHKRMFWETFPNVGNRSLHFKDCLSKEDYELVDRGAFFSYLFYCNIIGKCTICVIIFLALYYRYCMFMGIEVDPKTNIFHVQSFEDAFSSPFFANLMTLSMFSLIVWFNMCLVIVTNRHLLRMYYHGAKDEYICMFLGQLNPFKVRRVICKARDLDVVGYSFIQKLAGNYNLKDHPIVINHNSFRKLYHYNRLLGLVD